MKHCRITDLGWRVLREAESVDSSNTMLEDLSKQELTALDTVLDSLLDNVSEQQMPPFSSCDTCVHLSQEPDASLRCLYNGEMLSSEDLPQRCRFSQRRKRGTRRVLRTR